jgi:hypothetical protein
MGSLKRGDWALLQAKKKKKNIRKHKEKNGKKQNGTESIQSQSDGSRAKGGMDMDGLGG